MMGCVHLRVRLTRPPETVSERSTNKTTRYQGRHSVQSTPTIDPRHISIAQNPIIPEGTASDSSGHETTHSPTTQNHDSNSIADAASSTARSYPTFGWTQDQNNQSSSDAPDLAVAHEGIRMASAQMGNQVTLH
jgi:hypothetical protein